MKVTQVVKGSSIFYLCNECLKQAKTYNKDLIILETGYSNCDLCESIDTYARVKFILRMR